MPTPSPHDRTRRRLGTGLAFALCAVGIGWGASPASASTAESRGHACACGMGCKTKCCCGGGGGDRASRPADVPHAPHPRATDETRSGPCLVGSPCGGGGPLPPPTAPQAAGERADRAGSPALRPAGPGELHAPPSSDVDAARMNSRLDDPPERPIAD